MKSGLYDRGGGLIFDDILKVTWLQNANYAATELTDDRVDDIISAVGAINGHTLEMADFKKKADGNYTGEMTWWGAMAWADQLVYQGYNDWRLPHISPVNGNNYVFSSGIEHNYYDKGEIDRGFNIHAPGTKYEYDPQKNLKPGSEMAYMYHINLENKSYVDIEGNADNSWETPPNTSFIDGNSEAVSFDNVQSSSVENLVNAPVYWSDMKYVPEQENPPESEYALYVNFTTGKQDHYNMYDPQFAWAVRDGDSSESKLKVPTNLRIKRI